MIQNHFRKDHFLNLNIAVVYIHSEIYCRIRFG